jgi:hypothetical protein
MRTTYFFAGLELVFWFTLAATSIVLEALV